MKQLSVNNDKFKSLNNTLLVKILGLSFLLIGMMGLKGLAQDLQIEWEKNLGGSGGDYANSIVQTSDGGFAITGESESSNGDVGGNNGAYDCWVGKLNNAGGLQWEKHFGGSSDDEANSIIQTPDGGFAVAGESESSDGDVGGNNGNDDYWVVKLNNSGAIQWEKHFGGSGRDRAKSIIQTSDGGFAIAGFSESSDGDVGGNNGNADYWVVKLNNSGAIQWEKNLGGSFDDEASSIVQTSDNGFAIAGYSGSSSGDVGGNNGDDDYWVVKLDNSGTIQWEKNLGGSGGDYANSIVQTSDNGFAIAGESESSDGDVGGNHGNNDYWIVKLDNAGTLQWEKNLGGVIDDNANSIVQTSDNGFAIAGESESSNGDVGGNHGNFDYWIVKLNNAGTLQWEKNLGGSSYDFVSSILQSSDGNFAIAGYSSSSDVDIGGNNGDYDYWLVKLSCTPATATIDTSVCKAYKTPSGDATYTQSGTYEDTLKNTTAKGCDSIITINLTINGVDSSVSNTGDTLKANTSGATYQWLDCDSSYAKVDGATNQSFTPSANRHYAVVVTKNGCTDTSSCHQVATTSIASNSSKASFELYPNPATNKLTIVQQNNLKPQTFELQTLTGQRIKTGKLTGTETLLDVNNLSPGVYVLEVQGEEAVRTKKVVVE